MAVTIATAVLTLIAGIGLFLIACNTMSSNLESVGSEKLRALFSKITKSKLVGVGIGTATTAVIQSSSATTVMIIGFVNAGMMNLTQAASIIYGANIGTTVTGQLVSLGMFGTNMISTSVIFATLAGIGAGFIAFAKRDSLKRAGGILAGFGMLFIGLSMMSGSMDSFASLPEVTLFLARIKNPLLLVVIGASLTAVVHSSSVMTSIAITMVVAGLINPEQGIYVTMGANIGTCIDAIIASVAGERNAKRAALIHLLFNVFGVALFMLIGMAMREGSAGRITFGTLFERMFPSAPQTQLAMFHTIFNCVTVAIILPFTKYLVKLVTLIIPDKKSVGTKEDKPIGFRYVEEHMLSTPAIAVQQVKNEIVGMAETAIENFDIACDMMCTLDFEKLETFEKNENRLNYLNKELVGFIVKLSKCELSEGDAKYLAGAYHSITDLERVGDYAENITEYAFALKSFGGKLSKVAEGEIRFMQNKIANLYEKAMIAYVDGDMKAYLSAVEIEDEIDDLSKEMTDKHIARMSDGTCSAEVSAQYLSFVTGAERVADHYINVAKSIK